VGPVERVGGFLGPWDPCGQLAVEVGQEVFAWRIAARSRGAQFDGHT
jgi:hypothetical protein